MVNAHNFNDMVFAYERGEGVGIGIGRDALARFVRYWQGRPEYRDLRGHRDGITLGVSAQEIILLTVDAAEKADRQADGIE